MSHKFFFCHLGQFNRTQYNGPASRYFSPAKKKDDRPNILFPCLQEKMRLGFSTFESGIAGGGNNEKYSAPGLSPLFQPVQSIYGNDDFQKLCPSQPPDILRQPCAVFAQKSANPYKRHNAVLRFRLKCLNCLLCTDLRQSEIRNNIESGWVWLSCSRMLHLFSPLLLLERCVCGQYLWATI